MQAYIVLQYYNPYCYIYWLCQRLRLSASGLLLCLCETERGGVSGLQRAGVGEGGVKFGMKVRRDSQSLYNTQSRSLINAAWSLN